MTRSPARIFVASAMALHLVLTLVSSLGGFGLEAPFFSALVLCLLLCIHDRTLCFIIPAFLVGALLFLSPMVFFETRIASHSFRGDDVYDVGIMRAFYWFIGMIPTYFLFGLPRLEHFDSRSAGFIKTDAGPIIAGLILVVFSMLMLRNGTILAAGYREVTLESARISMIEFASLFTLIGFLSVRSPAARKFLLACVAIYLLSCLMTGLRLRFLSVLLVTICCTRGLYINDRWKVIGAGLALFLFVLGMVRSTGLVNADLTIRTYIELISYRGSVDSTFGGAFQTTKFYAYYIDTLASVNGLGGGYFLMGDLLSIFLTRGGIPSDIEIKTATQAYFALPGGGLAPGYFFAYGGLAGSVVLSACFAALLVGILRLRDPVLVPFKIILIAYAPRILFYDWVVGFKMMFIFLVLATLIRVLARGLGRSDFPYSVPHGLRNG